MLECFARMPPTTMEEGEVLPEALVEEVAAQVIGCSGTKKARDSKMLLPSVLTIIFTPSKIIYPVIRHQRHVSVKSEPHEKLHHT